MSQPALDRLRQGPTLCDGAMGTMLYARASASQMHGRCFDELNLTAPELVQEIHRQYILAGAEVIETNTFGANAAKLEAYGLGERTRALNRRAAQLAREAREVAGRAVFIAGAVGPSGQPVSAAPDDDPRMVALRALFREQIEGLIEGGADLLILETFSSLGELRQAVLAAREAGGLPIIAQMTFTEDGQSLAGDSPTEAARALARLGVDVIGANCSVGPAGILDVVTEMADALRESGIDPERDILLSAQPNAGLPTRVENRFLYVSTPAYFAEYARRFASTGARLIGGCCGTTPDHIAAMSASLATYLPAPLAASWAAPMLLPRQAPAETPAEAAEVETSQLQRDLAAGRFAVSIELDPPKGLNPGKILEGAARLREAGVRYINIADSPMARVRMSCIAMARLLRDHLDLESIVHITTRDRNMMALQSDLLGAHALGVRNVLALTGDPVRAGNYPNLTGVWDVDSVGLVRILHGMNEGHDVAGASLGMPARFFIGAALNLNMDDHLIDVDQERRRGKLAPLDQRARAHEGMEGHSHAGLTESEMELHRLRHKLDAGAQFIMTQPVYELAPLERFLDAFGPVGAPLILGMIPLHSSKHAEYLHNEVPGISIPDDVRARMRDAGERGREVGIELAREVVTQARERGLIQGCYLMPSYGRYDLVADLAQELLRDESE